MRAARLGQRVLGRRAFSNAVDVNYPPASVTLGDLLPKTKPVVTVPVGSSLIEVAKKMTTESASTVFVEDNGFVVGIVKEKNIIHEVNKQGATGDYSLFKAAEFMDKEIRYGAPTSTVRESLEFLHESKQDHLPITNLSMTGSEQLKVDQMRVLDVNSIISAKHIIGQFYCDIIGTHPESVSREEREKLESEAQKAYKLPTVKHLMKIKQQKSEEKGEMATMVLNTIYEDKISVAEAICQMTKYDKGSVAVMDICRDTPVLRGILTEQDIIRRALALEVDLNSTPVVDIMTSSGLATVTSKDTLLACAFKMVDANVRHLPVVSSKGSNIVAMVSSKDVVAYFCEAWEQ